MIVYAVLIQRIHLLGRIKFGMVRQGFFEGVEEVQDLIQDAENKLLGLAWAEGLR